MICVCGCGRFIPVAQTLRGRNWRRLQGIGFIRGHNNVLRRGRPRPELYGIRIGTPRASSHPSTVDIAWMAGIFEGEGWAGVRSGTSAGATVTQKEPWILERLQQFVGGSVRNGSKNRRYPPNQIFHWDVSGSLARGFLMTIYKFLSPHKKRQVIGALRYSRSGTGNIMSGMSTA